jgi:hypothetical protein
MRQPRYKFYNGSMDQVCEFLLFLLSPQDCRHLTRPISEPQIPEGVSIDPLLQGEDPISNDESAKQGLLGEQGLLEGPGLLEVVGEDLLRYQSPYMTAFDLLSTAFMLTNMRTVCLDNIWIDFFGSNWIDHLSSINPTLAEVLEDYHKSVQRPPREFECRVCHSHFDSRSQLLSHLGTHIPGDCFVCTDCGNRFASGSILAIHQHRGRHNASEAGRLCLKLILESEWIYVVILDQQGGAVMLPAVLVWQHPHLKGLLWKPSGLDSYKF